jgi:hypothetical protein
MRIRIQLINFCADPDPDFYWMRIQVIKMMRALADPDPQHWLPEHVEHHLTVNKSLRSVRFSEVSKLDTGDSAQETILHCTLKDDENLRPVYKKPISEY